MDSTYEVVFFWFFLSVHSAPLSFVKEGSFHIMFSRFLPTFKKKRRGRQSVQDCHWSLDLLWNERQGLSKPQLTLY